MPSLRIHETQNPLLYEINTRVWLDELLPHDRKGVRRPQKGRAVTPVVIGALNEIAGLGFDLVWPMGVWQTGGVGEKLAREFVERNPELTRGLDDFDPMKDVVGSPYAVQDYKVADTFGGPKALAVWRKALAQKGIGLVLDFVPNHTARDHAWVRTHPDYYVQGTEEDQQNDPTGYFVAETAQGQRLLAHGRDPHFPPWGDTAQLNYRHARARAALIQTLLEIADQCDGVRCDMAMLVLEEVFARTWGERAQPADGAAATGQFWAEAIDAVRARHPNFLFLAEAYWGLEGRLQELGFNYTYDKTLYDRLLHQGAGSVHGHLCAEPDFQARSARFLENHDEPRAAEAFPLDQHRAAALLTYTLPGMRFFHEGQLEGRRFRVPVQLRRRPKEPPQAEIQKFYQSLLRELGQPAFRTGSWKLLHPRPAWEGNATFQQVLAHRWEHPCGARVVAVNYGPQQAQCYVPLQLHGIAGRKVRLRDLFTHDPLDRNGDELLNPGLYLDLAPFQFHLVEFSRP
ncbi:MAG: alpha-amylase family glycosyl hydrolase [Candidatus Acidiferrales bacterium]